MIASVDYDVHGIYVVLEALPGFVLRHGSAVDCYVTLHKQQLRLSH